MKKIIISIITLGFFLTACNEDPDPVSKTVDVTYPTITLVGNALIGQSVGTGSYVDPGASGYDDISQVTTTLSPVFSNVDLTKPGFYAVKYSMKNANGFITNVTRLVLVTTVDASQDISGIYHRTTNAQDINVVKIGTGLYTTDNLGGVAGRPEYIYPIYFGVTTDSTIDVPLQENPLGGDVFCTGGTIDLNTPVTYSYIIHGSGYLDNRRTFVKQ